MASPFRLAGRILSSIRESGRRKLDAVRIWRLGPLVASVILASGMAAAQQRLEPPSPLEPKQGNPYIREGDAHYGRREDKRFGPVADRSEMPGMTDAREGIRPRMYTGKKYI